ncbi:hypothetical protein [Streptomyces sp. NPDC047009]|uniref:hypothetical protein n=1 Tax=Streptomyces sp. NPDC047009 TaxID=3154496 RepID=UPI00340A4D56
MLRRAQLDAWGDPLTSVLGEINSGGDVDGGGDVDLVDRLRRVLQVFCLPSPPQLLPGIRRAMLEGPETSLTLNAEQERAYRDHCEKVVQFLSAGDRFTYVTHRALYAM